MESEDLNPILYTKDIKDLNEHGNRDVDYYLEQYRIYLHIFNSTSDRGHKSNEFFLGLNAAIIGILGYVEAKNLPHANIIFFLIPFVGISISYSWFKIIKSYSQLNKAKFKIIHALEEKLPVALFTAEWQALGLGKDTKKYLPFSRIEKNIPITFLVFYIIILAANMPWDYFL